MVQSSASCSEESSSIILRPTVTLISSDVLRRELAAKQIFPQCKLCSTGMKIICTTSADQPWAPAPIGKAFGVLHPRCSQQQAFQGAPSRLAGTRPGRNHQRAEAGQGDASEGVPHQEETRKHSARSAAPGASPKGLRYNGGRCEDPAPLLDSGRIEEMPAQEEGCHAMWQVPCVGPWGEELPHAPTMLQVR